MRFPALALATMLLVPVPANAASIGTFTWVHDVLFGTGSTFSVINASVDSFEDVFVDLFAPEAISPFSSLSLGDVNAGASSQSIDDLSFLLLPFDLDRALLRLTVSDTAVTTELLASSLPGDPTDFLSGSVDIVVSDSTPAPVSEPSTFFLLATALAMGVGRSYAPRVSRASR